MKTKLPRHLTVNQLVAHKLAVAREEKGWTQQQAAERLETYLGQRWSRATFSAAERSAQGRRPREFTVNEVVAFARAFGHSIDWFFIPPDDGLHFHTDAVIIHHGREGDPEVRTRSELTDSATLLGLVVNNQDVPASVGHEIADELKALADRLERATATHAALATASDQRALDALQLQHAALLASLEAGKIAETVAGRTPGSSGRLQKRRQRKGTSE